MKKSISVLLTAALILSASGCMAQNNSEAASSATQPSESSVTSAPETTAASAETTTAATTTEMTTAAATEATSVTSPTVSEPENVIPNNAKTFKHYDIYSNEGYPIISTYLPDGWTANTLMNYCISSSFPLQAISAMTSPDGTYGVFYFSPMSYADNTNLYDGVRTADDGTHSIMDYATFYHYRNAFETSDLILSTMGYKWTERSSLPVDKKVLNEYNSYVKNKADNNYKTQKNAMDSSGIRYQSLTLKNSGGTIDRSRGTLTDGNQSFYAETLTYVGMQTMRFEADTLMLLNQVYGTEATAWQYDGFSIYWATDEKTFNENYDMAQFIISNTGTTKSFAAAQNQILSTVIPMILNGKQEISDYGQQTVRQIMQGWSDTNERVAQNWDDYILDQDRYTAGNGTEITVPTSADYVYYDGSNGDVIWTNSALNDPGSSYQLLNKKN